MSARTPHKHAEVIKVWADGGEIQWRYTAHQRDAWKLYISATEPPPVGTPRYEWRVKPQQVECFLIVNTQGSFMTGPGDPYANLKLTFDENVLIAAEILKK